VFIFSEGLLEIANLYPDMVYTTGSFFYYLCPTLILKKGLKDPGINLNELDTNKLYVYQSDNKTLAYVFDSIEQGARFLTPQRCSHLSDSEISQKKNIY
jgi:hypothetical protein